MITHEEVKETQYLLFEKQTHNNRKHILLMSKIKMVYY
jgi:hypothetical protein